MVAQPLGMDANAVALLDAHLRQAPEAVHQALVPLREHAHGQIRDDLRRLRGLAVGQRQPARHVQDRRRIRA